MKIKIEVTQDDILKGCLGSSNCPVARAMERQIGKPPMFHSTNAGYLSLVAFEAGSRVKMKTPWRVRKFMNRFDSRSEPERNKLKPFKFWFDTSKKVVW